MKRTTNKRSSKSTNKKVNIKFDFKNFSFIDIKWKSPNDNMENDFNVNFNPKKFNTIEIEDKH